MDQIQVTWAGAGDDGAALAARVRVAAAQLAADRRAGRVPEAQLPYDEEMTDAVRRRTEPLREQCDALVVIAPRAVAACVRAVQAALNPPTYNLMSDRTRTGPQLFVLDDGADPDAVRAVLDLLGPRLKKATVHAADPAGDGDAVAAYLAVFADALRGKAGKKYKDRLLVTTGPGPTPLRQVAVAEGLTLLDAPACAAGPAAMFSPATLFAAEMCGIDVDALLDGARATDRRARDGDLANNPAAMLGAFAAAGGGPTGRHVAASATLDPICEWAKLVLDWPGALLLDIERFAHRPDVPADVRNWPTFARLAGSSLQALSATRLATARRSALETGRPAVTIRLPLVSPHTIGQLAGLFQAAARFRAVLRDVVSPRPRRDADGPVQQPPGLTAGDEAVAEKAAAADKRDPKYVV